MMYKKLNHPNATRHSCIPMKRLLALARRSLSVTASAPLAMTYHAVCAMLPKAHDGLNYWNYATYLPFIRKRVQAITTLLERHDRREICFVSDEGDARRPLEIYRDLEEENALLQRDLRYYDIWQKSGEPWRFCPTYRPFNFPV